MTGYLVRLLSLALLLALGGLAGGCHTVQGAGHDVSEVGERMERALD